LSTVLLAAPGPRDLTTQLKLESIADPIRLRVVRYLDEHGAASL
jgi:hypothetical protein